MSLKIQSVFLFFSDCRRSRLQRSWRAVSVARLPTLKARPHNSIPLPGMCTADNVYLGTYARTRVVVQIYESHGMCLHSCFVYIP